MFPNWFPKSVAAISGNSVIGWVPEKGYLEYNVGKDLIKKFLNSFGIGYFRVSDKTYVNLSYVKLVTKKDNWLHLYFYDGFTIHFDCKYFDEIEFKVNINTFDGQCGMFIDLDESYATEGKDGSVAYIESITFGDIFGYTYVDMKICEDKPVYFNSLTLGDFLHNIKSGAIWINDQDL